MRYSLRPATEADFEFVRTLHHETLRAYVEPIWGWDECFQDAEVRRIFIPQTFKIIQLGSIDAGILVTTESDTEIFLASISVTPSMQNCGLGTAVINDVMTDAKKKRLPVTLQVLSTNIPAKRLYERLGFEVTEDAGTHFRMRFSPPTQ